MDIVALFCGIESDREEALVICVDSALWKGGKKLETKENGMAAFYCFPVNPKASCEPFEQTGKKEEEKRREESEILPLYPQFSSFACHGDINDSHFTSSSD